MLQIMNSRISTISLLLSVTLVATQVTHGRDAPQVPLQSAVRTIITPEFSSYIENLLDTSNITGLSLAIIKGDDTEFGTWGNRTESGEKMTPDTLFNIASCSKAFLASAVGILIEDYATKRNVTPLPHGLAQFNWQTKLKDILPGQWELMDEWASAKANIQDVLSHTSGLPRHDLSYGPLDSPKDVVARMRFLKPSFELREKYSYNNQMYMLGAHLISTYTGSYTEFARKRIFDPLNMTSTTFSPDEAARTGKLTQSWTGSKRQLPFWFRESVVPLNAGPGGIISSAVDLAHWVKTLLASGVNIYNNITIIPKSTFEATTSAHVIQYGTPPSSDTSIIGYGMGWSRTAHAGHEVVFHSGSIPGFSTLVAFLPADGFGVVLLTNTDGKDDENNSILIRTIDDALGLERTPSVINSRPSPNDELNAPYQPRIHPNETYLSRYSGTYKNLGYGSFTLCDPSSTSFYCTEVLSDFTAVDSASYGHAVALHDNMLIVGSNYEIIQLVAAWPRAWSSHVRLVHLEGHKFQVSTPWLFPSGYGSDETPFMINALGAASATAEFVVEDGRVVGFGVFGGVGASTNGFGTTIEKSDIWFTKVD